METARCPFYGIDCEYIPVAQKVSAYADEIEWLREALSAIAATEGVDKINPDADAKMMWIGCAQIARFALQQKGSK